MKECNLITMHRAHLKRKAEFEESETIVVDKGPFVQAMDDLIIKADDERQKAYNLKLIEDGRGWRDAHRGPSGPARDVPHE